MLAAFIIYLIGMLSAFNFLLGVGVVIGTILTVGCAVTIGSADASDTKEEIDSYREFRNRSFIATIILSVFVAFTPSQKTAYMMVGAYMAQTALTSETGDKVFNLINKELDALLKEEK